MGAWDLAAGAVWAMTPSALETVLEVASRCGEGPEAVAARLGRPLENTRTVTVRDGVAVVPVVGPLFRRANLLTQVSGARSVEVLATSRHVRLTGRGRAYRAEILHFVQCRMVLLPLPATKTERPVRISANGIISIG